MIALLAFFAPLAVNAVLPLFQCGDKAPGFYLVESRPLNDNGRIVTGYHALSDQAASAWGKVIAANPDKDTLQMWYCSGDPLED